MTLPETVLREPVLDPGRVQRLAVFRALHLGDFLCAVPAMRALDEAFPDAEITLIGLPWNRSVVSRFGFIDRFLEFPGFWGLENVPWEESTTRQFLRDAVGHGYDLSIQLHGDGRISNHFVSLLGARNAIGYRNTGHRRRAVLNLELPFAEDEHEVLRCLRLVEAVGASGRPTLEFPLLREDREEIDALVKATGLVEGRRTIVVHPGASAEAKRWPAEMFARAADRVACAARADVVITGTTAELAVAQEVAARMRTRPSILAGRTSVGGLAALIARSVLLISNDSGPSHLAAAAGTPSVVLFGPSNPARWAPLDAGLHRAIRAEAGEDMSAISVQHVVDESLYLVRLAL